MRIDLPMIEFFGRGGALKPSWYGDCLPSRDFPMLVDLYLQGRLDLDRFVSETIGLDDVEDGLRPHAARRGAAQRCDARMTARIEKVVTSGTFTLDGQDFDVDNNVWLVGDDREVLVIDAAHDPAAILAAVGDRRLSAIVCTHGHNDHINAAPRVAEGHRGTHPAASGRCRCCGGWSTGTASRTASWRGEQEIEVAGTRLRVLHTPGHSPGSVCLYAASAGHAVLRRHAVPRRARCDRAVLLGLRDTIIASIRGKLLGLPPETVVHTGHGEDTTIGGEAAQFRE